MLNDSGDRTEYLTGAVRYMKSGKGRCDLLPLGVLFNYFDRKENIKKGMRTILKEFSNYQESNEIKYLYRILGLTSNLMFDNSDMNMILELSIHFEEGAEKYGVDNWKKGIPEWSYIDSAIRHLLKWARGDEDERHDRAFVWNIVCLIWTVENKENAYE